MSGNTGNGAVTYTYAVKGSTDYSAAVPTAAGTYTVKATIAETANYQGAEATADFTIGKATISPTVTLQGWTYNGQANTPVVSGNTGNGAVTYTYAVKGSTDYSAVQPFLQPLVLTLSKLRLLRLPTIRVQKPLPTLLSVKQQ